MKKTLYIILTLIALGLLYVRVRYSAPSGESLSSPTPTTTSASPSTEPRVALSKTLNNDYFGLSYPEVATTSTSTAPDSQEWAITYMGEEQVKSGLTQTELWDGYAISITRFEATGDNPDRVQAEADRQGTIDACGVENVTEIKNGKVGSYAALTYFGGCLGEADQYYLMIADTLYRVTVMVVGSDNYKTGYQTTTSAILETLRFK